MSEKQHTPLRYDGHGLNSADEYATRLLTFARKPASDGGEYVLERADQDALGAFIARAVNAHAALVDALQQARDTLTAVGADVCNMAEPGQKPVTIGEIVCDALGAAGVSS